MALALSKVKAWHWVYLGCWLTVSLTLRLVVNFEDDHNKATQLLADAWPWITYGAVLYGAIMLVEHLLKRTGTSATGWFALWWYFLAGLSLGMGKDLISPLENPDGFDLMFDQVVFEVWFLMVCISVGYVLFQLFKLKVGSIRTRDNPWIDCLGALLIGLSLNAVIDSIVPCDKTDEALVFMAGLESEVLILLVCLSVLLGAAFGLVKNTPNKSVIPAWPHRKVGLVGGLFRGSLSWQHVPPWVFAETGLLLTDRNCSNLVRNASSCPPIVLNRRGAHPLVVMPRCPLPLSF